MVNADGVKARDAAEHSSAAEFFLPPLLDCVDCSCLLGGDAAALVLGLAGAEEVDSADVALGEGAWDGVGLSEGDGEADSDSAAIDGEAEISTGLATLGSVRGHNAKPATRTRTSTAVNAARIFG